VRKLCERPGCGAPVDVSYGIDKGNLVVWIDRLEVGDREITGKLCRRHALSLTVPRGWTIDDRRVEIPELFVARIEDLSIDEKKPKAKSHRAKSPTNPAQRHGLVRDDRVSLFDSIAEELAAAEQTSSQIAEPQSHDAHHGEEAPGIIDVVDEVVPTGDATAWTPRLTRGEVDDADKPVMGRLLGRAFGERPRSAVPHSFDPDAPDTDVVDPDSSGSISAIDLRGEDE